MALRPRLLARTPASFPRSSLVSLLASVALVILLALAGCAPSGGTSEQSGGSTSATPTPTLAPPSATPEPTTCAEVSGFGSANPLTLPNMEFPTGAVASAPTTSGGGTGQFSVATYSVCVPNNTASLTVTTGKGPKPFLALLLFYGWGPNGTFPGDGQVQRICTGGAKCFLKPDDESFLAVDQVTALSHGLVTFRLRQATPPPAPTCNATDFPDTSYHVSEDQGNGVSIPLPPLTRVGMGQGAAGSTYIQMCSAGTAASVSAFYQQAAPAYGYQPGQYGAGSWQLTRNGHIYAFSVTNVTDPTNWTLRIYHV